MSRKGNGGKCLTCHTYHRPVCESSRQWSWPLQPLLDAYKEHGTTPPKTANTDRIGDVAADRAAIAIGLHPEQIWPGWTRKALTPRDERFIHGGGWRQAWLAKETAA